MGEIPRKLTGPWKIMLGRLLSFRKGPFLGNMLVFAGVKHTTAMDQFHHPILFCWWQLISRDVHNALKTFPCGTGWYHPQNWSPGCKRTLGLNDCWTNYWHGPLLMVMANHDGYAPKFMRIVCQCACHSAWLVDASLSKADLCWICDSWTVGSQLTFYSYWQRELPPSSFLK